MKIMMTVSFGLIVIGYPEKYNLIIKGKNNFCPCHPVIIPSIQISTNISP